MKKLCALMFAAAIFFALLCPLTALAEEAGNTENIHLISPSAVVFSDGFLFVADNITSEQSVVHVFDVSGAKPSLRTTFDFEQQVNRLRAFDGTLYVLAADCYFEVDLTDFSLEKKTTAIRDLAVVGSDTYFLKNDGVYKNDNNKEIFVDDSNGEIRSLAVVGTDIVVLFGSTIRIHYTLTSGNSPFQAVNGAATYFGTVEMGGKAAFFNSTSLFCDGSEVLTKNEYDFLDIAIDGTTIFVLNSNNQVFKFDFDGAAYTKNQSFAIGSDKVTIAPPTLSEITSFTLAYSKGYPSNIVYLANEVSNQPSITDLVPQTGDTMFLILGYSGDNLHDYYYVFYEGKFGWVKKSINSSQTVEDDLKLQIVNTKFPSVVKGKLMSANAVYVYYLPYLEETPSGVKHTFSQSADNLTSVTLLQQFECEGQSWYLVSYQNGTRFGFVKKGDVGQFSSTSQTTQLQLVARKKINASLSDNVNVFVTSELLEDQKTIDPESGEVLTLSSGLIVNVLEENENASFLQIVYADGKKFYGWVENKFLIDTNQLTTNAIVGIVLISVAVATTAGVLIALKLLKKPQSQPATD